MSKCRITVVKKDLYADLIARYCDPATVPCEVFEVGDEFLVDRESFFNLRFRKPFCSEAWNAISTYVFTMVQGGEPSWAVNHTILACCNDGARPVVFKLERIDIPEDEADQAYLATKDFSCSAEDAYTG